MKRSLIYMNKAINMQYEEIEEAFPIEKFDMSVVKTNLEKLIIKWQNYDIIVCILSSAGILISVIEYELAFSPNRNHQNCANNPYNSLKLATFILTFCSTICVFFRFKTQQKLYKLQLTNQYNRHYRHLFQRKSILYLILLIEIIILWIFPYPFLKSHFYILEYTTQISKKLSHSVCYTFSELFLVIMSTRFYFIVKCLFNHYSYRDIFSSYFCNKFKTRAGFRFSLRSLMANHQWLLVLTIIIPSILFLAEILRVFERPYSDISGQNFDNFANALWCLLATMATIGYGDFYPSTYGGRAVSLLSTLWGGFSLSWIVIVSSAWLYLSPEEELALESIVYEKYKRKRVLNSMASIGMQEFLFEGVISDTYKEKQPKGKRIYSNLINKIRKIENKLDQFLSLTK